MNIEQKLNEYKENIETLAEIDSLEVYQWLMKLGEKLANDPLGKDKHIMENKVTKCQYDMYVDIEDNRFKAWSKAMIAGGYAYVLIDIFNSLDDEERKKITVEHFQKIKLDELLTLNRQTGFYQMIEIMLKKVHTA
jgi:sulfur transfer protein SufE